MTEYSTLNVKLRNSQLNKLKLGIKNRAEAALKISLNVVCDSNDESNFPHKLLLTNARVSRLRRAFANNSSANIKLSNTQLHKIEQSGGFLDRLLGPSLRTGLPLIGNVLKPLAKSNVLIPLGLTAAAWATDAAIHKKMFGSGMRPRMLASRPSDLTKQTTLIISNEEMNNIMKTIISLEKPGLLIKGFSGKEGFSVCY